MELNVETILKLGIKEKYKLFLMYGKDWFSEKAQKDSTYTEIYSDVLEAIENGIEEKFNIHLILTGDVKGIKGILQNSIIIGSLQINMTTFNKELIQREIMLDKWLITMFDKKRIWSVQV